MQLPVYTYNYYRYSFLHGYYLLTTETGSYVKLLPEEFLCVKKDNLTFELFNKLVEAGIILTANSAQSEIERMKKRYAFVSNGTSLHIIVPTFRCNLFCTYCFAQPKHASQNEFDMTFETAKQTVEFVMANPCPALSLVFQGGECLLNFPVMKYCIEYALELNKTHKKDMTLGLMSNLIELTDEMAHYFAKHNINVCTSLDGPQPLHDKYRYTVKNGKKIGTYHDLIKKIKYMNSLYKQYGHDNKVYALPTISDESVQYYKEIIDEYINLGIEVFHIRPITEVGNGLKVHFDKNKYEEFWNLCLAYIEQKIQETGLALEESSLELYKRKIIDKEPAYHTDFESPCGAITGQILYHYNGDIHTCHETINEPLFKIGNVAEDTWNSLFKKKKVSAIILSSMVDANPMCDRCALKPYCGTCIVENFNTGNKLEFYPTKTRRHWMTHLMAKRLIFSNDSSDTS